MSNTIRPKVSEAVKQIASSDSTGNSKSKIDTQKEFQALQDYLSGNYEELNTTEKNSIQRLLDNAKKYLKNTLDKNEQVNEGDTLQKPVGNTTVTSQEKYPKNQIYGDEDGATNDNEPVGNTTVTSQEKYPKNQNYGDEDGATNDNELNNNDPLSTQEKNDAYQQNKTPGKKVTHNGKMCIEMPNGHLYDMQGRRIK